MSLFFGCNVIWSLNFFLHSLLMAFTVPYYSYIVLVYKTLAGLLSLYLARGLINETVLILMETSPDDVDVDQIFEDLRDIDGVRKVSYI